MPLQGPTATWPRSKGAMQQPQGHTVAAAAGVTVVVQCPIDLVNLLHYDEVALLSSSDGVSGVDGDT